jgi:hypothetical protein
MRAQDVIRIAAGILIGLGLASLPFLQYGAPSHHHATAAAHGHHH